MWFGSDVKHWISARINHILFNSTRGFAYASCKTPDVLDHWPQITAQAYKGSCIVWSQNGAGADQSHIGFRFWTELVSKVWEPYVVARQSQDISMLTFTILDKFSVCWPCLDFLYFMWSCKVYLVSFQSCWKHIMEKSSCNNSKYIQFHL